MGWSNYGNQGYGGNNINATNKSFTIGTCVILGWVLGPLAMIISCVGCFFAYQIDDSEEAYENQFASYAQEPILQHQSNHNGQPYQPSYQRQPPTQVSNIKYKPQMQTNSRYNGEQSVNFQPNHSNNRYIQNQAPPSRHQMSNYGSHSSRKPYYSPEYQSEDGWA